MALRGSLGYAGVWSLILGCSAAQPAGSPDTGGSGAGSGGGFVLNMGGASAGMPPIGTSMGGAGGNGDTCAATSAQATLIKQPVDIVLVLDNSGSMQDELDAVEKNINVKFASILQESGVDYRVILISRHRRGPRTESGEASTSVCVSAPLSGLAACPADAPVNSERFYQYSIKIESTDSFDRILSTYNQPDKFKLTMVGWSEWLRPGAKKVFLEMTDDNAVMAIDTFVQKLSALSPANFGTDVAHPTFVFHSIVGLQQKAPVTTPYLATEPVQMATCTGGNNTVANVGVGYQELSRRTGGLRFPLCAFESYDAVFSTIANDVVTKSQLACDFDIPTPSNGQELDLSKVAVAFSQDGASAPVQFGQAKTSAECQAGAFYIESNHIYLCPETCTQVKAGNGAKVDVLFTCQSQIIVK